MMSARAVAPVIDPGRVGIPRRHRRLTVWQPTRGHGLGHTDRVEIVVSVIVVVAHVALRLPWRTLPVGTC